MNVEMMRIRLLSCCWLGLLIAFAMPACRAEAAALTIDAQQQLNFAEQLYRNGQFRRAAEEYDRFAYFFPNHAMLRTALLKAGQAFFQSGDAASALAPLKKLTATENLDPLAVEAFLIMADCYLQMKAPTQAVVQLNNLIVLSDDPAYADRAYFRIGWIHIEQTDWSGARRAFGQISPAGQSRYRISELIAALNRSADISQKNPALAGTLSIIPGAGQFYCRRYQDALAAFVVNVGLIWAAYEAFDQEQNALGGLLAFVGIGFYTGNIYGAVSSAHKYNRVQKSRFVDQIKEHLTIGISPSPQAGIDGIFFSWRVRF